MSGKSWLEDDLVGALEAEAEANLRGVATEPRPPDATVVMLHCAKLPQVAVAFPLIQMCLTVREGVWGCREGWVGWGSGGGSGEGGGVSVGGCEKERCVVVG